jgi:hypothetical protein
MLDARPVRRSVMLPCQVVRERDFRLVSHAMLDLSELGMLVVADRPVLTGSQVIVAFRAPLAGRWIDALAMVARVEHGRRPRDRGVCLGLAFEHVDRQSRELLESQLAWFREATPRRRRLSAPSGC